MGCLAPVRAREEGARQWMQLLGRRHWPPANDSLTPSWLCVTEHCSAAGARDVGRGLLRAPVLSM